MRDNCEHDENIWEIRFYGHAETGRACLREACIVKTIADILYFDEKNEKYLPIEKRHTPFLCSITNLESGKHMSYEDLENLSFQALNFNPIPEKREPAPAGV